MPLRIDSIFDYINGKSPVLIVTPTARRFGNCGEDVYHGLLKARREGKKIIFVYEHKLFWKFSAVVANRELLNIESDYDAVGFNSAWRNFGGLLLAFVFAPYRVFNSLFVKSLSVLNKFFPRWKPPYRAFKPVPQICLLDLWKPAGVNHFSWDIVEKLDWKQQYSELLILEMAKEKQRHAEAIREQMGIPKSDWFVCLHIRESGFHQDTKFHLNSSIDTYLEGIRVITDAGGWVVRIGDTTMTPLPPMERVIDYPHTPFKSELMDIYLLNECRFYVGTNSGPYDVARLFQKPMVLVNLVEWSLTFPPRMGDLAIFRHVFSHSRNRFLSLQEILIETAQCQFLFRIPTGYDRYENSSDEISDLIQEFLDGAGQAKHSELQKAFNQERSRQLRRFVDETSFARSTPEHISRQYRVASRTDSLLGAMGQKYLEQNWVDDSLNRRDMKVEATH